MLGGSPFSNDVDEAAAALGVTAAVAGLPLDEDRGVWREHLPAVHLFDVMRTQWRMGPRGPVGFDYNVMPQALAAARIPRRQHRPVFEDFRVMEQGALDYYAKLANK